MNPDPHDVLSLLNLEKVMQFACKASQSGTEQMLRRTRDDLRNCASTLIETSIALGQMSAANPCDLLQSHAVVARCLAVIGPSARMLIENSCQNNRMSTKVADALAINRKGCIDVYTNLVVGYLSDVLYF